MLAPLEGFVFWGAGEQVSPRVFTVGSEAAFIWLSLHCEATTLDPDGTDEKSQAETAEATRFLQARGNDGGLAKEEVRCLGYRRVSIIQSCLQNKK